MCRCVCFQSERSSRQSLLFLHPTHQNFNFISVSGCFDRIIYLFFMAEIQFPRKSSALTTSFNVRQPPNASFVLSDQPTEPRLPCGCCNMQHAGGGFFAKFIVELVNIELRKRGVWRYFRKKSYF